MNTNDMLLRNKGIWDAAPTTFARTDDWPVDEPEDRFDYNPTDAECDRAADAYERRLGL